MRLSIGFCFGSFVEENVLDNIDNDQFVSMHN